ncbi:MAG: hypothetical protein LBB83_01460 [Treponema sp.]|jgi:hypothetical protein|nr:hypothetical protein [Treponema sp.]
MNKTDLERLDQETTQRILRAVGDAENQIRRAKRALRSRVQEAVSDHRERIVQAAQGPEKTDKRVDYQRLGAILERQPLTYDIIKRETGLNDGGVAQVITTLSLMYPVWDPAKGIYELLR